MTKPLWAFNVKHRNLRVEVVLNGAVAYRWHNADYNHYALKFNSWLIEGQNRITVSVGPLEEGEDMSPLAELAFGVFATEHGASPEDVRNLAALVLNLDDHEIDKEGLTQVLAHDFDATAAESFGRWAWQDAKPYVPNERLAVETLVGKLHTALAQRDVDRVIELTAIRLAEQSRSIRLPASEAEKDLRDALTELFKNDDWVVDDIDYAALLVYPSEDGLLVEVLDHDGRPPFRGGPGDERPFAMGAVVSLIDNTWQVVR